MEENTEYYIQDESLKYHVDNILSFKKFLENILLEIKSNNYNKNMIKLLSRHIEKSLSEISNDTTLFEYDKNNDDNFIPSVKIVSVDSDISENISDSNSDDESEESITKKLDFYQSKMDLYSPHIVPKTTYEKIYEDSTDLYEESKLQIIHYNPDPDSVTSIRDTSSKDIEEKYNFKPKDKLVHEFLNNNLKLDNYHYLKSLDLDNINNYCNSTKIY